MLTSTVITCVFISIGSVAFVVIGYFIFRIRKQEQRIRFSLNAANREADEVEQKLANLQAMLNA